MAKLNNNKVNSNKTNRNGNNNKTGSNKAKSKNWNSKRRRSKNSNNSDNTDDYSDINNSNSANTTNDPQWYMGSGLATPIGTINWTEPAGKIIKRLPGNRDFFGNAAKVDFVNPGIMMFEITPTFGLVDSVKHPINVAATSMYEFMRSCNAGTANGDANDIMLYMISVGNMIALTNWVMRLYGTLNLFTTQNMYLPEKLLEAEGVEVKDWITAKANIRAYINQFINRISGLFCPSVLPYFDRCINLYRNIYCESDSIRDQLYITHPAGFYQYNEMDGTHFEAGYCKFVPVPTQLTYANLRDYLDQFYETLAQSEFICTLSGDLMKAFGDKRFSWMYMPDDYTVTPVTDTAGMLMQLKNATIWDDDLMNNDVFQSPDGRFLESFPEIKVEDEAGVIGAEKVIDSLVDNPSPEAIMEWTRLTTSGYAEDSSGEGPAHPICMTELCTGVKIFSADLPQPLEVHHVVNTSVYSLNFQLLSKVCKFQYAPEFFIKDTETTNAGDTIDCYRDVFSTTVPGKLSVDSLADLHYYALVSLFQAPATNIIAKEHSKRDRKSVV